MLPVEVREHGSYRVPKWRRNHDYKGLFDASSRTPLAPLLQIALRVGWNLAKCTVTSLGITADIGAHIRKTLSLRRLQHRLCALASFKLYAGELTKGICESSSTLRYSRVNRETGEAPIQIGRAH